MITILGASGFIGSHLAKKLETDGAEYQAIGRSDALPLKNLGDVIYCIGLTADFRSRFLDTVEAHVCTLLEVIRNHEFDSLLYLSSTRLYLEADSTDEDKPLRLTPQHAENVFNISKAMGESIVLHCGRKTRVARVSNVYGPDFASDNFLSTIIRDAVGSGKIVLRTAAESAKDYISLTDVVEGLIRIATGGSERIYNLASGVNVSHRELLDKLRALTGCTIEFEPGAPTVSFPPINIERMRREFAFAPRSVLDDLARLVELYKHDRQ